MFFCFHDELFSIICFLDAFLEKLEKSISICNFINFKIFFLKNLIYLS